MGLFGFVKKVAGKVLKTGLSVATRGVSDKVLSAFKAMNQQKRAARIQTLADKTLALKFTPRVKNTEQTARNIVIGATRSGGQVGDTRTRTTIEGGGRAIPGGGSRKSRRGAARQGTRRRRATRTRQPMATAAAPRATGVRAKRAAPASFAKHAARARELAAEWRAAGGKEGTGMGFFEWKRGK